MNCGYLPCLIASTVLYFSVNSVLFFRLEYFLQSLAEKIEDLPKTWVGRTSKLELTVQQAQEKHYRIMDKRSEFSNICSDSPNHRYRKLTSCL